MQVREHGWARRWTVKLVRDSGRVLNGAPQFVGRPEGELQLQAVVGRVWPSRTSGFSACQVFVADLILERQSAALLPSCARPISLSLFSFCVFACSISGICVWWFAALAAASYAFPHRSKPSFLILYAASSISASCRIPDFSIPEFLFPCFLGLFFLAASCCCCCSCRFSSSLGRGSVC